MWKEILGATALSTALAITPAMAQEGQPQQMQGETQGMTGQQEQAQYQGWPVFTSDGEKLGEVTDVMPGGAGQGEKLRVESGGFFGFGSKTVEISPGLYKAAQNRIELQMTAEQARDLPDAS
jgi:sporulation protein YlmC with PRC-barrel domain